MFLTHSHTWCHQTEASWGTPEGGGPSYTHLPDFILVTQTLGHKLLLFPNAVISTLGLVTACAQACESVGSRKDLTGV